MEILEKLLINPRCTICEFKKTKSKEVAIICTKCTNELFILNSTSCIVCDSPSIFGMTHLRCQTQTTPKAVFCIYKYENAVRHIITKAKYQNKEFYALKKLTQLGIQQAMLNGLNLNKELIAVPIPLSKQKLKSRGFNQAEHISTIVKKLTKIKHNNNIIIRKKATLAQHHKGRYSRYTNIKNAFVINNRAFTRGADYLLVDDICTSGATFREAAKTLYKAGANQVYCLALSKAEIHKKTNQSGKIQTWVL